MSVTRFLISLFLICPLFGYAQFTYLTDQSIEVEDQNGDVLPLPWAGGLNSAQFNRMDINGDGLEDLVLFDRMANQVLTYVNSNNTFQYAPEYESLFPSAVTRFMLLRDFNCDGKKDIFSGHSFGMTVFVNVTGENENLRWEQFYFYAGTSRTDQVLTQGFSQKTNLQLQYDDLPAIVDVDSDGDLDILNVRFTGDGSIEYHRNLSKERYNSCDSLDFERVTQAWGGVTQCRCENFAFNNDDCSTSGGRVKHGGGKALLVLDLNNDGEKDVLFSEAECPNIFSLINQGTADNPIISEANYFPANPQVNLNIFPAAFYEDVDHDNVKDLIVIPNNFQRDFQDQDYNSSTWLYKNTGSNDNPQFAFVKNNFLQEHMIDVGDNSVPAFVDADGDGDLDLFIGYYSDETESGSIYHYTNIGTANAPKFRFTSDDFMDLSSLDLYNIKSQFVDINRDGKKDLLFVATDESLNETNVYYFLNVAEAGIGYDLQNLEIIDLNLISSENVHFTDVNNDGFIDALVGRSNGSLDYWRNSKTSEPAFALNTLGYLGFTSAIFRQNISCFAEDLDDDGKTDLLISDHSGKLGIIEDYKSKGVNGIGNELKNLIYNPVTDLYDSAKLGGRLWPVVVNLFSSERPSLLVGNTLGGLRVFNNDNRGEDFEDLILSIYPNPLKETQLLKIRSNLNLQLQIYSSIGRQLTPVIPINANTVESLDLSSFAKGVYILKFIGEGGYVIRRVVLH